MSRPDYIPGRPPLFTADQVRALRGEYRLRQRVLRHTRSLERMAGDMGINVNALRQMLTRETYKWVR